MTSGDVFLQQLINGLTIGVVYALIALGYTMVYGIIRLINFAHGEIFMAGSYLGLVVFGWLGVSGTVSGWMFPVVLAAGFAGAMGGCGLLGSAIERVAYRPLRDAPRLAPLITAIGVSFFLQNAVMLLFGPSDQSFPPILPARKFSLGGATITLLQVFILAVSLGFMIFLQYFITRTKWGKALRATSSDRKAAGLVGINVDRVISLCFFIGSALGAAGGVLYGMYYNSVNFFIGYMAGLKAFTAAVLGGIGSVPGAMLGGILLGLVEGLGAGYLSSEWKNAYAFVILVLLLLFRPQGILGEKVSERA